jgi:hypothetical protein
MDHRVSLVALLFTAVSLSAAGGAPLAGPRQESEAKIRHSFLALGGETYIMNADGTIPWSFPKSTRDGFVLPNGNLLLTVGKCSQYPRGAVVELTRDGMIVFQFIGTQSEVNTAQAIGEGRWMVTEAGNHPRILEVDRDGKILVEVPIRAQTKDHHLQTRMSRKLPNGNYLVPQLLDKVVREYAPDGNIVWEAKTPMEPQESWPFTAIRLANGNTLTTCTHGLLVVEFDFNGRIVWQLANSDLPSPLLADPCGAQRLSNGNTVIASYGQNKPGEPKLFEVTPEKKVVWVYRDNREHGIHEFQILDTNDKPLEGPLMK